MIAITLTVDKEKLYVIRRGLELLIDEESQTHCWTQEARSKSEMREKLARELIGEIDATLF